MNGTRHTHIQKWKMKKPKCTRNSLREKRWNVMHGLSTKRADSDNFLGRYLFNSVSYIQQFAYHTHPSAVPQESTHKHKHNHLMGKYVLALMLSICYTCDRACHFTSYKNSYFFHIGNAFPYCCHQCVSVNLLPR